MIIIQHRNRYLNLTGRILYYLSFCSVTSITNFIVILKYYYRDEHPLSRNRSGEITNIRNANFVAWNDFCNKIWIANISLPSYYILLPFLLRFCLFTKATMDSSLSHTSCPKQGVEIQFHDTRFKIN